MARIQRSERKTVKKIGRIIWPGTSRVEGCVIVNISQTGALLRVSGFSPPDAFLLLQKSAKTLHEVRVVRRTSATIAVQFQSTLPALSEEAQALTECPLSGLL